MYQMIKEVDGLQAKLKCLITDRAPAQVAANKLLIELYNRDRDQAHHLFQITCGMHTVVRVCAQSAKALSIEA